MNPLAEEDVDEMIEALDLEPGAHVLDLGCGKAEILLRIVERYPDVRATGLDNSPAILAEARRQAEERVPESKVTLLEEDVREYAPEPGSYDLVVSTGGISFRGGVGGTLAANALSLAAMRATLGEVLTDEAFARMIPLAERWASGVEASIAEAGLPWHVTRLGCRAEYLFGPDRPRNGSEAHACADFGLERFMHLHALNRGVLLTPFHNMALMAPTTMDTDVDLHTAAFDEIVAGLVG